MKDILLRNTFSIIVLVLVMVVGVVFAHANKNKESKAAKNATSMAKKKQPEKIVKTDAEWRKLLTKEQYRVTRQKGTEDAFTGKYNKFYEKGVYLCVCCDYELFDSRTKYDSKTGWPSFWEPMIDGHVGEITDRTLGMVRVEVVCNRCDAHLGHVFPDGPQPTGQRYCINSASLKFVPESELSTGDKQSK